MNQPLVSVIIPTKNSAQYLQRTISSIRAQTYGNIEVVIVDNHSNDATPDLARAFADRLIVGGNERSAQMNLGAAAARGEYLYRVDSDFVVEPEVVAEAVALCSGGADAVAVPNDSDPTVSFWSAVRHLERKMYRGDDLVVGARFFSAEAFRAVGGFDEELIAGEDYDIHNRLLDRGYKIMRTEHGELHLGEPRTLAEIIRKSWQYGKQLPDFLDRNAERGRKQLNPLRAAYLRHWRDFLAHPLLAAGFFVMQTCKYGAGGAAFVKRRLEQKAERRRG